MEKFVDYSVEKGWDSKIFEAFAKTIENLMLDPNCTPGNWKSLHQIHNINLSIEAYLQDLTEGEDGMSPGEKENIAKIKHRVYQLLVGWLVTLEWIKDELTKMLLITQMNLLDLLLSTISKEKDFTMGIYLLQRLVPKEAEVQEINIGDPAFSFYLYKKKSHSSAAHKIALLLQHHEDSGIQVKIKDVATTWQLKLKTNSNNSTQISYLLWVLSSGLETIEDVTIELADWGRGTFWAKLRITMKTLFAKEEITDVLEKSVQAAKDYYLNQHIETVAHLRAETETLKEELKHKPTVEQSQELTELQLESARQDVKAKELAYKIQEAEHALIKLELQKKLSELIRDGLIQVDSDYTLSIEGVLICKKEDGKFYIGESLRQIDTDETGSAVES